jgi:hypothetical protein
VIVCDHADRALLISPASKVSFGYRGWTTTPHGGSCKTLRPRTCDGNLVSHAPLTFVSLFEGRSDVQNPICHWFLLTDKALLMLPDRGSFPYWNSRGTHGFRAWTLEGIAFEELSPYLIKQRTSTWIVEMYTYIQYDSVGFGEAFAMRWQLPTWLWHSFRQAFAIWVGAFASMSQCKATFNSLYSIPNIT